MLTRRSLLKLFGIGGAAAVVAPSVLEVPIEAAPEPKEWKRNEISVVMEAPPQFVAPGAFCALEALNSARRPVFNSLPTFKAQRGSVKVPSIP